jgi:hypothetical protein
VRRQADEAADRDRRSAEAARAKSKSAAPAAQVAGDQPKDSARKKDNPYARPFGRLTVAELEQQITDTEIALAECQQSFGDPGSFKDPAGSQRLQAEYKAFQAKLEALEAEYFAREE